ncbi:acyltransferase family protein [Arthrobacter sulfonylureivorans]|uniref:Acyltransferase family protein n=1 Tax=Arthrobacter sulfonylureivorans TaxID=2486855 RepID=A0ABY3WE23_9MICC|nr:acyltransferase family protein [Arthrobacter sulfonylureivorans]UNK47435.1 acyltransferase family protein [Arthrobacter sulfonylureivorans]
MTSPASQRNLRLDTAKGLLIFAVVLGHFLEEIGSWKADGTRLALTGIYMFHMPAFVFLAGVTAKTSRLGQRIGTFAVILVAFQTLYFVFVSVLGIDRQFSIERPFWILWFLLGMMWWLLLLPAIARFPRAAILLSIVIALVVGALDSVGYSLSLSRALVFLPFFVVGATYGKRIVHALGEATLVWKAVALVAALGGWLLVYSQDIPHQWLYGSFSFDRLDTPDALGLGTRGALLLLAAVAIAALLCVAPNRQGFVARVGRHSLAVYVLHGFVVLAVAEALPAIQDLWGSTGVLVLGLVLAAVTTMLLALPVFENTIRRASGHVVSSYSAAVAKSSGERVDAR